jgi:DNA uptake protein ComE-like DNA-binding protein
VAPHLKALFQGLDVTIFAYGVTGTGKTHTMRGGLKLADRGVIPRLLSGIYRRGKKIVKDSNGETTVDVSLSYYEIYNDKVFDLLEPPEKRQPSGLPLREKDGKTIVVGLSERSCQDLKDFERLYIEANTNRITAATKLNAHSSRSHAILRVKVTQITGDMVRESTASAIDLAGSEDNRRTDNGKERLVESAAINKSLFVLSQCIDAIGRGDKRIPYRESKMTRILSLGQNNGITIMILNLAPIRSYHLDTISSLNVSSRAKRIEVREIENEVVFKQVPRAPSNVASSSIQRQPLRPLANVHNIHSGAMATKAVDANKPTKAFNVYADRIKPSIAPIARPQANTHIRRSDSNKRPSDTESAARPAKIARPAQSHISVSAAQLEAMVERKVSEILASRTSQPSAPPPAPVTAPVQPNINEVVQKRLEALERRVDNEEWRDDARSDGLRFLTAAKRRKEVGDEAGALQMYELALPFFPGKTSLLEKIERLRAKTRSSAKDTAMSEANEPKHQQKRQASNDDDGEYQDADADNDDSLIERPSKPKSKKQKARPAKVALPETEGPPTPRSKQLLDIVNSQDVTKIKGLHGFGAKKARDLVDYLQLTAEDDGGMIESLAQLRTVPGMGGRTVERAYEGLVSVV